MRKSRATPVCALSALLFVCLAGTHDSAVGQSDFPVDTVPPSIPDVFVHEIVRGHPGGSGFGHIYLAVSSRDDRMPQTIIRYLVELVDGELPRNLHLPEHPLSPRHTFENGRNVDLITLRWDEGKTEVQDPISFGIVLYAMDRAGNVSKASDKVSVFHSGSQIDMVFSYGHRGRNRLDTRQGIFVKDMVADPPVTLELTLTENERNQVAAKAEEIGFFEMPRIVEPEDTACSATPCGSFYLQLRIGNRMHQVYWDDCSCWEMESLVELRLMIQEMIEAKDAYKTSPKPRGAYY